MTVLEEQYDFRTALVERLERDLVGPLMADEILEDAPLEQYIAGVLYPLADDPLQRNDSEQDVDVEQMGGLDLDNDVDPPEEGETTGNPGDCGLSGDRTFCAPLLHRRVP